MHGIWSVLDKIFSSWSSSQASWFHHSGCQDFLCLKRERSRERDHLHKSWGVRPYGLLLNSLLTSSSKERVRWPSLGERLMLKKPHHSRCTINFLQPNDCWVTCFAEVSYRMRTMSESLHNKWYYVRWWFHNFLTNSTCLVPCFILLSMSLSNTSWGLIQTTNLSVKAFIMIMFLS